MVRSESVKTLCKPQKYMHMFQQHWMNMIYIQNTFHSFTLSYINTLELKIPQRLDEHFLFLPMNSQEILIIEWSIQYNAMYLFVVCLMMRLLDIRGWMLESDQPITCYNYFSDWRLPNYQRDVWWGINYNTTVTLLFNFLFALTKQ